MVLSLFEKGLESHQKTPLIHDVIGSETPVGSSCNIYLVK